ncbi:MAG: transposon-encoded TnpW family protein [Lachnospiraceae bacterium]|nr:transposon-encoded TnpW family protein [Lachnospiraceae bacterium]
MTELDIGKTHVIVHSVFSKTSRETAVDKVMKLILQHLDDAESYPKNILLTPESRATIVREGGASLEEKNGT